MFLYWPVTSRKENENIRVYFLAPYNKASSVLKKGKDLNNKNLKRKNYEIKVQHKENITPNSMQMLLHEKTTEA